ncbi:hypothetical protein LDENG_00165040 [Lucifuga dentata]|nr:hypothetical protein LDENG_00165040 [Lucifuga dentata]
MKPAKELHYFTVWEAEGQRISYSLPDTGDTFTAAVNALKKYLSPKVNVVVERHAFRKWKQASHETIIQYIAALHDLAAKCDFDDKCNKMIHDQLLENLRSDCIRERLLLEPDLTLEKAMTLATQLEAAVDQVKKILADSVAPVQAVQSKPHTIKGKPYPRPVKPPTAATHRSCFRCGSDRHLANSPQEIQLVVDTGSAVSILPTCIQSALSAPSMKLVTYTQDHIPILGCLQAQVQVGTASAATTFFIVEKGTALLGMDLISTLPLCIS